MPLNINQEDFNVVKQPFINKYLKLNILNFNLSVVNEISGNLISFDVSVNADSDLRRSCSVSLVVTDSSFEPENGSQIWLDKFIQPYVGYENIYTGEVQWYNQGIYLINTPTYFYDATNNTLSFQGLDLMSKLTGVRNGALPGVPTVIPQGSNVREAMIAAIKLAGFTKYVVDECVNTDGSVQAVPYDIQVNQGGYIFDIIKQLRDILPNYQVYFDVDGVFHYDQIPSGDNDPVLIDDTLWNEVNMSDNITTDFESVKNYIEVYGKSHTVNYFPSATSISGATLNLTISGYTETAGNMIGFVPTANILSKAYVRVNNGTSRQLVDSAGNGVKNLEKDVYYVAVYQTNNTYLFLGHQQAQAIATDDNPESPFYVNGSVGMIRQVLSGGDYDNIMSDELALQRAKLEIYWKCRLNDSIALTCIPIPWVDVNILVSHAPKSGNRQKKYMIKSFSASYGDSTTMTINAISYYAYYQPVTPEPEPVLPEGYTQLEYIAASGTQYIDTGYKPNSSTKLTATLQFVSSSSGNKFCFGARTSNSVGRFSLGYSFGSSGSWFFGYNTTVPNVTSAVSPTGKTSVIIDKNVCTVGGYSATASQSTFSCAQNLVLFADNEGGTIGQNGSIKLYDCSIYDNGVLIRNFIPARNSSGTLGLYDTVNGAFYTNAGSGTFTAGADINNNFIAGTEITY